MLDRLYVFDGYAGWDPEVKFSGYCANVIHAVQHMLTLLSMQMLYMCGAAVDGHLHLKMLSASLCSL